MYYARLLVWLIYCVTVCYDWAECQSAVSAVDYTPKPLVVCFFKALMHLSTATMSTYCAMSCWYVYVAKYRCDYGFLSILIMPRFVLLLICLLRVYCTSGVAIFQRWCCPKFQKSRGLAVQSTGFAVVYTRFCSSLLLLWLPSTLFCCCDCHAQLCDCSTVAVMGLLHLGGATFERRCCPKFQKSGGLAVQIPELQISV